MSSASCVGTLRLGVGTVDVTGVNRSELISVTASRAEMDPDEVARVLDTFFELAAERLEASDSVNIRRFGKLEPRHRKAMVKPNPMSGDDMHVPERVSVAFVPSDILKERLNK